MLVGLEAHRFAWEPGDDGSAWEESASHPTSPFVLGKGVPQVRIDANFAVCCHVQALHSGAKHSPLSLASLAALRA